MLWFPRDSKTYGDILWHRKEISEKAKCFPPSFNIRKLNIELDGGILTILFDIMF